MFKLNAKDLYVQYDGKSEAFVSGFDSYDEASRKRFLSLLPEEFTPNRSHLLDLGCGDGRDLEECSNRGAIVSGVDTSEEMIALTDRRSFEGDIRKESFTKTSFDNTSFDWVISKWALQTTPDLDEVYKEAGRLLVRGGTLLFLIVHPIRQFIEKKRREKDYFEKEVVESILFDGAVVAHEPTHTMEEVLSPFFLKHFDVRVFEELVDDAAEVIGGDIYPSCLIVRTVKR